VLAQVPQEVVHKRRPRACRPPDDVTNANHLVDTAAGQDLVLEFIPLTWESYDIALAGAALGAARPLITAVTNPDIHTAIIALCARRAGVAAAQHRDLVAQQQDLEVVGSVSPGE